MRKKKNWFALALVLVGAILFGVVAFVVMHSTRTVSAVVPAESIRAGERISGDMLATIQVPVDTPKGYITDRSSLIGQKLKITAQKGQFLYMSDVMMSWDDVVYGVTVPDDYIITAISIPNDRAVGGLITAGDTVDLLGVPKTGTNTDTYTLDRALGEIADHSYGADGMHLYWILANVKVLETDSSLSSEDDSILSSITDGGSAEGAYYIVALSYSDYQKLVLAEQYMNLYMNLSPAWNNENPPLLDVMNYSEIQGLADAQSQSILEQVTGQNDQVVTRIKPSVLAEMEKVKSEWASNNGQSYVPPQTESNEVGGNDAGQQVVDRVEEAAGGLLGPRGD